MAIGKREGFLELIWRLLAAKTKQRLKRAQSNDALQSAEPNRTRAEQLLLAISVGSLENQAASVIRLC